MSRYAGWIVSKDGQAAGFLHTFLEKVLSSFTLSDRVLPLRDTERSRAPSNGVSILLHKTQ